MKHHEDQVEVSVLLSLVLPEKGNTKETMRILSVIEKLGVLRRWSLVTVNQEPCTCVECLKKMIKESL